MKNAISTLGDYTRRLALVVSESTASVIARVKRDVANSQLQLSQEEEISSLKMALAKKDALAKTRWTTITEQKKIIESQKAAITGLNSAFMSLENKLTESIDDIASLKQALAESEARATMDPMLPGLLNKKATIAALSRRLENGRIKERFFTILYIDLDHFKKINDGYGHAVGDIVLLAVAKVLTQQTREGDIVSRLGGEELACTLCHDSREDGEVFAKRILDEIRAIQIFNSSGEMILNKDTGKPLGVTASIGTYTFYSDQESRNLTTEKMIGYILLKGDMSMYNAKRSGRNRVVSSYQADDEILELSHLEKAAIEAQMILSTDPQEKPIPEHVGHIHPEYLEKGQEGEQYTA